MKPVCLVMGAGVAGNRVHGGTDDTQNAQTVDLATGQVSSGGTALLAENVLSAVLHLTGADTSSYSTKAEPLHALIA